MSDEVIVVPSLSSVFNHDFLIFEMELTNIIRMGTFGLLLISFLSSIRTMVRCTAFCFSCSKLTVWIDVLRMVITFA